MAGLFKFAPKPAYDALLIISCSQVVTFAVRCWPKWSCLCVEPFRAGANWSWLPPGEASVRGTNPESPQRPAWGLPTIGRTIGAGNGFVQRVVGEGLKLCVLGLPAALPLPLKSAPQISG